MTKIIQKTGMALFIAAIAILIGSLFISNYQLADEVLKEVISESQLPHFKQNIEEIKGRTYTSKFIFLNDLDKVIQSTNTSINDYNQIGNQNLDNVSSIDDYNAGEYKVKLTKKATQGILTDHSLLMLWLTFGLGIIGALLYIIPKIAKSPGIKNDHIFHSANTSGKGWIGYIIGGLLILFYVLLYWYPQYITEWILLMDPISYSLNGGEASRWFFYGFLYTLAIVVMGVRMIIKYRHSKYHIIRTISVMFFQTAFAFLIPEILIRLNQPSMDLKNIWPLNYNFFYDYNLESLLSSGNLGLFMLIWGILLIVLAVPLFSYFYGKRWYCSWVCGCGGLAETLGDPYRQLSDKSVKAWKIERWMIHGVLVFAIVMTSAVLYTFFTGSGSFLFMDSYTIRQVYGFLIGAAFAGVVGVGFYPFMGNRVWCRFGCPLAAYIGLVQRFKSRFRITTNGGQCISCGNCSTYCEMGIDVRWYAQRGQNIIRSSCVGCGICSSVCPRGVLKLENGPEAGRFGAPILIGNKSITLEK